jgi:hypothetical protein
MCWQAMAAGAEIVGCAVLKEINCEECKEI